MAEQTLPHDVIVEILSRLPVKSLFRFRSVSKPWRSFIIHPDFVKKHLNLAVQNQNLNIIVRKYGLRTITHDSSFDKAVDTDYPFQSSSYGVDLLGSCDGLLCITAGEPGETDVCIWNPSTKEFKKLPPTPMDLLQAPFYMGCDKVLFGFGYDPTIDDYKVVRIIYHIGDRDKDFYTEVKVYTLKSNSWKRIADVPCYITYKRLHGCLVNTSLHWLATETDPYSSGEYLDLEKMIVAFDLIHEEFRELPQPQYPDPSFHMTIGVLKSCLCVISNFHKFRIEIWMMKEYGVGDSWTRQFTFVQPDLVPSFDYLRPIMFLKTDELILDKDMKELLLYDPKHGKATTLEVSGIEYGFETDTYVGSLVSLGSGTYMGKGGASGSGKSKKKKKKKSMGKKRYVDDWDDWL